MNNNLKKILEKQNKTQRDLANEIGLTESIISRYVKGERQPKYKNMIKIAKVLNVEVKEIWVY